MCPVPLCENCLKWNQKLPNSGKCKCAWKSVNSLKNKEKSPQRCHKLTVLKKYSPWDVLSCGCHLQPDWLFLLLGSEKKVAAPSVGSGRLSECSFPLCGVSLRVRTQCWLTITINTSDFSFELLGSFAAQLREPTMARSESPWKWSGRGSSKALAEVTGLPSLQQQEEPCEASKLINLRFPIAENPFLN